MNKYTDKDGRRVVEVEDLTFISDWNYPYNWFQRHFYHHRIRLALKRVDIVVAASEQVAIDLVRYYFVPKDKIVVRLKS